MCNTNRCDKVVGGFGPNFAAVFYLQLEFVLCPVLANSECFSTSPVQSVYSGLFFEFQNYEIVFLLIKSRVWKRIVG